MAEKKLPEFLTKPASEKQKLLLTQWGLKFEADITVLDFRNLRRDYLSLKAPSPKQVEFLNELLPTTTPEGQAMIKEYISKYQVNAYSVEVAIDMALNNKAQRAVETKDFSETFKLAI